MNFDKENEKFSYKIGLTLGFWFSYLIFFTITYFVFLRKVFPQVGYFMYIGIIIFLRIVYLLIKMTYKKIVGSARPS